MIIIVMIIHTSRARSTKETRALVAPAQGSGTSGVFLEAGFHSFPGGDAPKSEGSPPRNRASKGLRV